MHFYLVRKLIRKMPGTVIRLVPLPEPRIIKGYGERKAVGKICREKNLRSVLLVTDKTLSSLGFHKAVEASLLENDIACSVFSDISGEPSEEIIIKGRNAACHCHADGIIALGGGSVMDSCKIIAASTPYPKRSIRRFLQKFAFSKTLPMITIPSTAGTGAEETVGAVVKNSRGAKKATVVVGLKITDVILDSQLTENTPKHVTLSCGIDAFSHGLEGCMADVKANPEDIKKSRECVRLVFENLIAVSEDPHNIKKREKMCIAANYGGNAINKQLAGYVHAFAHTIGGYYHIPHGDAIGFCLLPVISYYKEICSDDFFDLSVYCGFAETGTDKETAVNRLFSEIAALLRDCGFHGGLKVLSEKDYPKLVKGIDFDSVNYSPKKTLSDREILRILGQIKRGES